MHRLSKGLITDNTRDGRAGCNDSSKSTTVVGLVQIKKTVPVRPTQFARRLWSWGERWLKAFMVSGLVTPSPTLEILTGAGPNACFLGDTPDFLAASRGKRSSEVVVWASVMVALLPFCRKRISRWGLGPKQRAVAATAAGAGVSENGETDLLRLLQSEECLCQHRQQLLAFIRFFREKALAPHAT